MEMNEVGDRELAEVLSAMLLQRRVVEFVESLDPVDRAIVEARLLAAHPVSIRELARVTRQSYRRAKARVESLEAQLREALRDPVLEAEAA